MDSEIQEGEVEDCKAEPGCVKFISSLSRVDGLVHLSPDLLLTGFGAEITVKADPTHVYVATESDPSNGDLSAIDPAHFGMRHRSMIRFCARHPEAVGFVISQDGDIRAVTAVDEKVVMWENVLVLNRHEDYINRMRRKWQLEDEKRDRTKRTHSK